LTDGSPMSSSLSARCWNPTARCGACRNDGVTVWGLAQAGERSLAGLDRSTAGIVPGGDAWAAGCPGSASRFPDRLEPIITTPGAIGQPLATGLQIGTLGELSEGREEPHASCARANVTRTHTHAQAHTRTRTRTHARAHYAHTRPHTHTRTHTHAHTRTREVSYTNRVPQCNK